MVVLPFTKNVLSLLFYHFVFNKTRDVSNPQNSVLGNLPINCSINLFLTFFLILFKFNYYFNRLELTSFSKFHIISKHSLESSLIRTSFTYQKSKRHYQKYIYLIPTPNKLINTHKNPTIQSLNHQIYRRRETKVKMYKNLSNCLEWTINLAAETVIVLNVLNP